MMMPLTKISCGDAAPRRETSFSTLFRRLRRALGHVVAKAGNGNRELAPGFYKYPPF